MLEMETKTDYMKEKDMEKQFKHILDYGLQKGNESPDISMNELIEDLSEKLKTLLPLTRKRT